MPESRRWRGLLPLLRCSTLVLLLSVWCAETHGEESDDSPVKSPPGATNDNEAPAPTPAAPDFGGPLDSRPKLTGDWWGQRPTLAERGITFDGEETQFYQGVAGGGLQRDFQYGGNGEYLLNVDFGKLMDQQGLFLKIRAEHRYGETINGETGSLLPAALAANLPTPQTDDLILTDVLFTQAFSEHFAVFAGKMDTLDGDNNAFAHGRGVDQFSNLAFVFNPIAARTIPYSTLGAGFVVMQDLQPMFTFSVLNASNTITTSGFNELFDDGAVLAAELRVPTQFFDKPGHQLIGGTWSDKTFTALGQDPRIIIPGSNVPIAQKDGSWCLYWNFDQYLHVDPCNPAQGWGLFGRAGISDANPNPLAWFLSFGVGGNSPLCGREADTFGVGWYYAKTSDQIGPLLGDLGDGQGVELYYNYAVNPWLHVTPDLQFIKSAVPGIDVATVLGLRVKMDF